MQVVFGANGRAGGEVARALLAKGEKVRVALRRPEQGEAWRKAGAEVAIADIGDARSVAAALAGAKGAFLVNPPPAGGDPFAVAEANGAAYAAALRSAPTPKIVLLSSVGAQHASGTGIIATLNRMEALLADFAPAVAFLRAGYFVETWGEVAGAAIHEGVLPTFLAPDQKIPMVSTIDIGAAASRLLSESWTGRRIIELGGPEEFSAGDIANAFATVLGRPVEPSFAPPEARADILAGAGVPRDVADALRGMYDGIASGRVAREEGTEHWRGATGLATAVKRLVEAAKAAG